MAQRFAYDPNSKRGKNRALSASRMPTNTIQTRCSFCGQPLELMAGQSIMCKCKRVHSYAPNRVKLSRKRRSALLDAIMAAAKEGQVEQAQGTAPAGQPPTGQAQDLPQQAQPQPA